MAWVGEGGAVSLVHGMYKWWCELCSVNTQLEHASRIATAVPARLICRQELLDRDEKRGR